MVNETTSVELLNLVLQYGSQRYRHGLAAGVLGLDTQGHGTAADALFARIAALVSQQPVQARDEFGTIWQHSCGMTGYGPGGSCPGNCGELGPWRPLFDAPGGAPAPEAARDHDAARAWAQLLEARGDYEAARAKLLDVVAQRDKARAQLNEEIAQTDEHAAWADRLAQAAIKRHGVRLTEEGGHEVWEAALAALTAQPDPLVLSLPEVPEGTVALVGVASLRRYILSGMRHAQWKVLGSTWIGGLTAVLTNEHPDGVRVEMAPPLDELK